MNFHGLFIICLMIDVVISAPYEDDGVIFVGSETGNIKNPFEWVARPVNEDDDDDFGKREALVDSKKDSSYSLSFMEAGAGWGR